MLYYYTKFSSPIGPLTAVSDDDALVGLWIEGQKYYAHAISLEKAKRIKDHPVLKATASWLEAYFDGACPSPDALMLAPVGSMFRQAVWNILRTIPYGETVTYGEIAHMIAARRGTDIRVSAQAVGSAVGHNPISIVIPCHRVLGADRRLHGYAGGLDCKVRLLSHEGITFMK